jgi:hypothetical protein
MNDTLNHPAHRKLGLFWNAYYRGPCTQIMNVVRAYGG